MELKIIPRMSEKSYAHSQTGIYIFDVPTSATKQEIASAVSRQFSVHVKDVNIAIAKGKTKRSYRGKARSPVMGKRKNIKKAYVRLAEGQSIPVFAAVESDSAAKTSESGQAKEKK